MKCVRVSEHIRQRRVHSLGGSVQLCLLMYPNLEVVLPCSTRGDAGESRKIVARIEECNGSAQRSGRLRGVMLRHRQREAPSRVAVAHPIASDAISTCRTGAVALHLSQATHIQSAASCTFPACNLGIVLAGTCDKNQDSVAATVPVCVSHWLPA